MSDEFEFPDEEEGYENDDMGNDGDDGGINDTHDDDDGDDQSPQRLYITAKDNIGLIDDAETIEQFMQVFENSEDQNLKSKAIGHALTIMAQSEDVDTVLQTLDKYIQMANSNQVKHVRFEKRIKEMLNYAWHSETLYVAILE